MIRKILYTLACAGCVVLMSACSEDALSPIDELGKTIYDPTQAEEGTVDAKINHFYEKYGSRVLYRFTPVDLAFAWSINAPKWYAPVKEGNEAYIERMMDFLEKDVFSEYPEAFIRKFLPYRIFLVDSICDSPTYKESALKDMMELKTHAIAIAHISPDMETIDWKKMQSGVTTGIMNNIYNSVSHKPTEFISLAPGGFMLWLSEDPLNEFPTEEFTLYNVGLVGANDAVLEYYGAYMYPTEQEDLGHFISFVMTTPKTRMDKIFARFALVKKRAFLIAKFITEEMEMDPVAMQNTSCPNDKVPADYFTK